METNTSDILYHMGAADEMAAFDNLPYWARELHNYSPLNFSTIVTEGALRDMGPELTFILFIDEVRYVYTSTPHEPNATYSPAFPNFRQVPPRFERGGGRKDRAPHRTPRLVGLRPRHQGRHL